MNRLKPVYCVYCEEETGLIKRLYRNLRFGIPMDSDVEFYYKPERQ